MYRISISIKADHQLSRLEARSKKSILHAVYHLQTNPRPHGVKKLQGTSNSWRIRVGNYRVIYEIHDDVLVVLVIEIAHRRDAYR